MGQQQSMAERFVELYRQWEEQPVVDGHADLSEFLHKNGHIGSDDHQVAFLQGWNVRHLGETGTNRDKPFENDARRYAVLDFHDGSYAFSPSGVEECHPRRRWLAGKPS